MKFAATKYPFIDAINSPIKIAPAIESFTLNSRYEAATVKAVPISR